LGAARSHVCGHPQRLAYVLESEYNYPMSNPMDRHLYLYGPQSSDRLPHFIPCPQGLHLKSTNKTGDYEQQQIVRRRYQCPAG
jgi:hypothetical protein